MELDKCKWRAVGGRTFTTQLTKRTSNEFKDDDQRIVSDIDRGLLITTTTTTMKPTSLLPPLPLPPPPSAPSHTRLRLLVEEER